LVICPRCKSEDSEEGKSWDVIPKTGKGKAMHVTMYKCRTCANKFRKAARLQVASHVKPKGEMRILVTGDIDGNNSTITAKLFEYIKAHDGILNIDQSAKDLEISVDEVKGVLETLQEDGKIKMESSAAETPAAHPSPVEPLSMPTDIKDVKGSVDTVDAPQRESIFQRLKRGLGF